MGTIQEVLRALTELPALLIYILLGVGAATENVIPPVPADTFVLAGALLAARGVASPWTVFLVTWLPNVLSAMAMYGLAHRYGRRFFKLPVARWLVRPHQLDRMGDFYDRYGVPAIFMSRFLPAWRALVPVFAGVTHVSAWKVGIPVFVASGIWYGLLVYLGTFFGRNLEHIVGIFNNLSSALLWVAVAVFLILGVWWWRTRHHHDDDDNDTDGGTPAGRGSRR